MKFTGYEIQDAGTNLNIFLHEENIPYEEFVEIVTIPAIQMWGRLTTKQAIQGFNGEKKLDLEHLRITLATHLSLLAPLNLLVKNDTITMKELIAENNYNAQVKKLTFSDFNQSPVSDFIEYEDYIKSIAMKQDQMVTIVSNRSENNNVISFARK
jgi:hypothetical protein